MFREGLAALRIRRPAGHLRINAFRKGAALPLPFFPKARSETPLQFGKGAGLQQLLAAVGQQHARLQQVVPGAAIDQRMGAAAVVAHHAADAAAVAGGGLRTEKEAVGFQRQVQFVAHHPGLHPDPMFLCIDFQYFCKMTTDVRHQAAAHHLPGDGGTARTGNQADPLFPRIADQLTDIRFRLRTGHAIGHLPIDAGIRGIGHPVQPVRMDYHSKAKRSEILERLASSV